MKKGPKIGAAKNFLPEATPTVTPDGSNDATRGLSDVAALETYKKNVKVLANEHDQSVTSEPVHRQFWSKITQKQLNEWGELPGVTICDFCHQCGGQRKCSGVVRLSETSQIIDAKCRTCWVRQKDCLFMVSYWSSTDDEGGEDSSENVERSGHALRELDHQWQVAPGRRISSADTTQVQHTPLNRPPEPQVTAATHASPTTLAQRKPLAEIRAVSRDLAEILVKDSYSTKPKGATRIFARVWQRRAFYRLRHGRRTGTQGDRIGSLRIK